MNALVALRFHGYRLDAGPAARGYVETVPSHPAMAAWIGVGRAEIEIIPAFDDDALAWSFSLDAARYRSPHHAG